MRSTFISHGDQCRRWHASKSIAVLMNLAAMLRIVRAVQFVLDKLTSLLRDKGRDEMRAMSFSAKRPAPALINMPHGHPATTRMQCRK